MKKIWLTAALLMIGHGAAATCYDYAGQIYGVSPDLLRAISHQENPKGDPLLVRRNTNGTYDHGLMQINSIWIKEIERYGYTRAHLFDPCANVVIGAWILKNQIAKKGYTWDAVGMYHSATPSRRDRYSEQIRRHLVIMGKLNG